MDAISNNVDGFVSKKKSQCMMETRSEKGTKRRKLRKKNEINLYILCLIDFFLFREIGARYDCGQQNENHYVIGLQ